MVQLRDQRTHIEELVDAVVEGYHAGFNKSIHNYSQILRLFTESKLQVGRGALGRGLSGSLGRGVIFLLMPLLRPHS